MFSRRGGLEPLGSEEDTSGPHNHIRQHSHAPIVVFHNILISGRYSVESLVARVMVAIAMLTPFD